MNRIVNGLTKIICERVETLHKQLRGVTSHARSGECNLTSDRCCCERCSVFTCRGRSSSSAAHLHISSERPGDIGDHGSQLQGVVDTRAQPGGEVPRGLLPSQRRTSRREGTTFIRFHRSQRLSSVRSCFTLPEHNTKAEINQ